MGSSDRYYSLPHSAEPGTLWALDKVFGSKLYRDWSSVDQPEKVLNLGCGRRTLEGAVNLDVVGWPGPEGGWIR